MHPHSGLSSSDILQILCWSGKSQSAVLYQFKASILISGEVNAEVCDGFMSME